MRDKQCQAHLIEWVQNLKSTFKLEDSAKQIFDNWCRVRLSNASARLLAALSEIPERLTGAQTKGLRRISEEVAQMSECIRILRIMEPGHLYVGALLPQVISTHHQHLMMNLCHPFRFKCFHPSFANCQC